MKPAAFTQTQLLLTSVLLLTLGALTAQAQDRSLVTGGTTYDSPNGGRWAYLFWRTEDPTAFLSNGTFGNSTFAIYAKSGAPNSVAPYAKVTDVSPQNNTSAVAALLARSVNLGQNLTLLNARIDEIFAPLLPLQGGGAAADFILADKVGVLLAAASNNEEVAQNLFFLARSHPGIDLVRGGGVALPIAAALTTYEVRLVDAAGEEVAVVGRVTLNGAVAAPRLPAPGRPISVPVVAEKKPNGLGNIPANALNDERQAILNRTLDRVARLRWATPDNLRRVSVLQHGYNVYRVQRAFAEANGWHDNPPAPAALRELADKATVPQVNRANTESPVIPDEELDGNQVTDFESNSEAFFVDDQRTLPGVEKAFVHGSQYYYFVAARDVLGRDGLVSQGTLVTMLNRLPPTPAQGVRTTNEYAWNADDNRSTQLLRVRWEPDPPIVPGVNDRAPLTYHVFRWPTADAYQKYLSQMDVSFVDGEGRQFGRITDDEGLSFAPGVQPSFLDNTPDAPNESTPRRTYWYTVVSVEKVELDPLEGGDPYLNISGHSAPGSGIIRKWDGPEAPEAHVYVDCYKPGILLEENVIYTVPIAERNEGFVQLRLECNRTTPTGIHWVEFIISGESLGRTYFGSGAVNLQRTFSLEESELLSLLDEVTQGKPFLQVIAGSDLGEGAVSETLTVNAATVTGTLSAYKDAGKGIKLLFAANLSSNRILLSEACTGGVILPENPTTGVVPQIDGIVVVGPETPEWRIYRRIDDGELFQVASGFHKLTEPGPVAWIAKATDAEGVLIDDSEDYIEPPANGGRICYYIQAFDVDGNGSPFTTVCLNSLPLGVATGQAQEHRPVISEITPIGTGIESDPAKLRIRWSAATGATKRFHLLINDGTSSPPEIYSVDGLGANLVPQGIEDGSQRGRAGVYPIVRYSARAPKPGGGFLEDTFQVDLPARSGRNYRVSIQAVALSRSTDPSNRVRDWGVIATSDPVDVVWTNPTLPATQQPDAMAWPQRLADTGELNPQVWAKFLDGSIQGVGIRIGQMTVDSFGIYTGDGKPGYTVPLPFVSGHVASKAFLFRNLEVGERFRVRTRPVLPFTLYRYRVPEGAEANPDLTKSSDIVQVSPLIEEVGYEHTDNAQNEDITVIRDPFIRLVPAAGGKLDIYVLDTHPVIRGERYSYVLVRFNEAHEIDKAYPVRAVDANNATLNAVVIPEP